MAEPQVRPDEAIIRIGFVGGSTLTRDLLAHVLSAAGMLVGTEPTTIEQSDVTIVIAEEDDPRRLLHEAQQRRVVVIADIDIDGDAIADLVLDGADAIVGLHAGSHELATAVRTVAAGGNVVPPRAARRIVELARSGRAASSPERALLTGRELDILLSIGRGESVKQTARTLGISAKTVENLQSRLFRKLDVRNRAQAFAQAHAMGLLPTSHDIP